MKISGASPVISFFYETLNDGDTIITAHHLNDSVETWVWSSLHGEGKIIQSTQEVTYNGKVITLLRPFLINTKEKMKSYVEPFGISPVEDNYNNDMSLTRNYIRNIMMPHILVVNPGIEKVIKKKYLK